MAANSYRLFRQNGNPCMVQRWDGGVMISLQPWATLRGLRGCKYL
jgi:hypothetical protein